MAVTLALGTVRVLTSDGAYVGLGWRVAADLVITCAHVVAQALGSDPRDAQAPTDAVLLELPFATAPDTTRPFTAILATDGWLPVADVAGAADLALLQVQGEPPPVAGPLAELAPNLSLAGIPFAAYGGPDGHQRHLIELAGRVRAPIGNGRWQLSARDSDYPIAPGCSGAPAIDQRSGLVIGLIAQDEQAPNVPAGFLIPAEHLRALLVQAGHPRPAVPGLRPLRNWVDRRLAPAAPLLADPVRRFIDYYAGTAAQPMPFAGRTDALAALDRQFAAGGGALQLVSGPAALGKSALLLHWIARRLRTDPDLRLLFLPVSIRFDTADERTGLRLLHAQLAALFAEVAFPPGTKPDQDDYRDRIAAGWRAMAERVGERFLLVIDGADEASGPWLERGVLPYEVPANLTLVLAARHQPGHTDGRGWLDSFPVAPAVQVPEPLELSPLDREAVGEAIEQLGHPLNDLPGRDGVLDALYRLTDQGDPLLVSLWVGQLWQRRAEADRLDAANLARLQPGYGGFVGIWLAEQAKLWRAAGIDAHPADLCRLLRVLCLARGPLRLPDWLAIAERLPSPPTWTADTGRRLLDSARRLVVGSADAGYAFVHPRLADHFRGELDDIKEERQAVPRAWLAWGAATVAALNEGTLPPDQCPTYLLRHYTAHVLDAELPLDQALDDHLLPLLQEGWMRAWEEEEGAYGGYLIDVQRVSDVVRQSNQERLRPPYRITPEVRCALIRSSIWSLSDSLSPDLIVALVQARVWTIERAIRVATDLPKPEKRFQALKKIAADAPHPMQHEAASLALAAARRLDSANSRDNALQNLLVDLASYSPFEGKVLDIAREISSSYVRDATLASVVKRFTENLVRLSESVFITKEIQSRPFRKDALVALFRAGSIEPALLAECLTLTKDVHDAEDRAEILMVAASRCAGNPHLFTIALGLANEIDKPHIRDDSLVNLIKKSSGDPKQLHKLLDLAWSISRNTQRADALAALAAPLVDQPGMLGTALKIVRSMPIRSRRSEVLAEFATRISSQPGMLARALKIAHSIPNSTDRARALAKIGHMHSKPEILAQALKVVRRTRHPIERADVLATIATESPENSAVLARALALAIEIGPEALASLAKRLTDFLILLASVLPNNLHLARSKSRSKDVNPALEIVAQCSTAHPAPLIDALEIVRSLQNERQRVTALTGVAAQLAGQPRFLASALDIVQGIQDEHLRAQGLISVADAMSGQCAALAKGLEIVKSILDEPSRANALNALSARLVGSPALLSGALKIIGDIQDESRRAEVISAFAPRLCGEVIPLAEALQIARNFQSEFFASKALFAVAAQLRGFPELLSDALAIARLYESDWSRAYLIKSTAGFLASHRSFCMDALVFTRRLSVEARVYALAAVAESAREHPGLLKDVLATSRVIGDDGCRLDCLAALAGLSCAGGDDLLVREVLLDIHAMEDDSARASSLMLLIRGTDRQPIHLALALDQVRTIKDEEMRGDLLIALAEAAGGDRSVFRAAFEEAAMLGDTETQIDVLTALKAIFLGELGRSSDKAQGEGVVLISESFWERLQALSAVAEEFICEPTSVAEALAGVYDDHDVPARAHAAALMEVAETLESQTFGYETGSFGWENSLDWDPGYVGRYRRFRADAENYLVRYFVSFLGNTDAEFRVLDLVPVELLQAAVLCSSAEQAGGDSQRLREVLAGAADIWEEHEEYRAMVFDAVALSSSRDPAVLFEVLALAGSILNPTYRERVLQGLASALARSVTAAGGNLGGIESFPLLKLFNELLHDAGRCSRQECLRIVSRVSPLIRALGDSNASREIALAIRDVGRWWP